MRSASQHPHTPDLPECARQAITHVASLVSSEAAPMPAGLGITAHFHPDRTHPNTGKHVLEGLVASGRYFSQFVTGTSNGGLTAHPGGDRFLWEQRIFGGAYDAAPAELRPIYAALNHRNRSVGAAPRFGSCYLRFHSRLEDRATFCYPDSGSNPRHFGVATAMPLIALADADDWDLAHTCPDAPDSPDLLNDYVEAHIHGGVCLSQDVAAIVLDPSYRGTPVEEMAENLPCPVEWHEGFAVHIRDLAAHEEYRGTEPLALAYRVAEEHTGDVVLTPRAIGDASRLHLHHPQHLKQVWHLVARFGWDWSHEPGDSR